MTFGVDLTPTDWQLESGNNQSTLESIYHRKRIFCANAVLVGFLHKQQYVYKFKSFTKIVDLLRTRKNNVYTQISHKT
jgi:hypothetical protein